MRRSGADEAKECFSELLREAEDAPQVVTVRGRPTAVVLSTRTHERLTGRKPSLVECLNASPLAGVWIELDRDRSFPREVRLGFPD